MNTDIQTSVVRWSIIVAIPFALTLGVVRLLIQWDSPSYPEFEYRRIEPDRYGFTPEERLSFAEASLDFLRRPEPAEESIYLLKELRLPGSDQPFYNQREIGHMFDVKVLVDNFRRLLWIFSLVVVAGLAILALRPETRLVALQALRTGGILTGGLVLAVMTLILVAWNLVFTQFHEILFPPDTWTFSFSDSLIRLFPNQFWFDFGVLWTVGILLSGAIVAAVGHFLLKAIRV